MSRKIELIKITELDHARYDDAIQTYMEIYTHITVKGRGTKCKRCLEIKDEQDAKYPSFNIPESGPTEGTLMCREHKSLGMVHIPLKSLMGTPIKIDVHNFNSLIIIYYYVST